MALQSHTPVNGTPSQAYQHVAVFGEQADRVGRLFDYEMQRLTDRLTAVHRLELQRAVRQSGWSGFLLGIAVGMTSLGVAFGLGFQILETLGIW